MFSILLTFSKFLDLVMVNWLTLTVMLEVVSKLMASLVLRVTMALLTPRTGDTLNLVEVWLFLSNTCRVKVPFTPYKQKKTIIIFHRIYFLIIYHTCTLCSHVLRTWVIRPVDHGVRNHVGVLRSKTVWDHKELISLVTPLPLIIIFHIIPIVLLCYRKFIVS